MQGNRASSRGEGEVSCIFSSCGRHVGYHTRIQFFPIQDKIFRLNHQESWSHCHWETPGNIWGHLWQSPPYLVDRDLREEVAISTMSFCCWPRVDNWVSCGLDPAEEILEWLSWAGAERHLPWSAHSEDLSTKWAVSTSKGRLPGPCWRRLDKVGPRPDHEKGFVQ